MSRRKRLNNSFVSKMIPSTMQWKLSRKTEWRDQEIPKRRWFWCRPSTGSEERGEPWRSWD
eukprot:522765-Karenia_brevis.AAC.1